MAVGLSFFYNLKYFLRAANKSLSCSLHVNNFILVFMDSQVDFGSCKGKNCTRSWMMIALTIKEVSTFVQIDLEIGTLNVELKVLLH